MVSYHIGGIRCMNAYIHSLKHTYIFPNKYYSPWKIQTDHRNVYKLLFKRKSWRKIDALNNLSDL